MRVALVGYGSIAGEHARAIADIAGVSGRNVPRIAAVVGRLPEPAAAFAARIGAELATTDLDEVLADPAIGAVVVCSPTDLHAPQTERALRAGKHVLCEIPLATSLAETDRLIALATAADRRLMVCHTQRYHPPQAEARRMVEHGELRPHAVIARYGFLRRENINWQGRRRSWTDNLIWHHGAHAVDAALWLLGAREAEVTAQVAPPSGPLGIPMDVGLVLRTPAGQIATVALSYNTHLPVSDYLLVGEETSVLVADGRLRGPDGVLVEAGADAERAAIREQDAEFFAAVVAGREPAISARDVRPAMAALQVAQDALETHPLPDIPTDPPAIF